MKLYPHNYAEIIAAITCTICLLIKPSVTNRWFIGFLWLTVCIEFTGKLLYHYTGAKMVMYNLFGIVECCFYLLFFSKINFSKKIRVLLKSLTITIIIAGLADFTFFEPIKLYSKTVGILISLCMLIACLFSLYSFLQEKLASSLGSVYLLVISGLLIFYAGNLFPDAAVNSSLSKNNSSFFTALYRLVNGNLNVIMYGIFTLAFVKEALLKPSENINS